MSWWDDLKSGFSKLLCCSSGSDDSRMEVDMGGHGHDDIMEACVNPYDETEILIPKHARKMTYADKEEFDEMIYSKRNSGDEFLHSQSVLKAIYGLSNYKTATLNKANAIHGLSVIMEEGISDSHSSKNTSKAQFLNPSRRSAGQISR